jgi:hypothetical protein
VSSFEGVSGADLLDPNQKKDASLTDFDYKVFAAMNKIVGKQWLAKDFLGYMTEYGALNQPLVPIGQIVGFTGFTATYSNVETAETTSSTSYVDLATVGPTVTDLPPGQYVILEGGYLRNSAASQASAMSFSINGAAASDDDLVGVTFTDNISAMRGSYETLTEQINTITAKYRVTGGTGTFARRWLIALKTANA